jgi:DNA-binding MarR family transcriptional regulator
MTVRADTGPAQADYLALAAFRCELRRFLALSESLAHEAGLKPQQQQLLLAIKGLPAGQTATISTLAARLQLRHHSVVELVDRLAAKGLIARTRKEADRRRVVITLTPTGERRLEPLVEGTLRAIGESGAELRKALEDVIAHAKALG